MDHCKSVAARVATAVPFSGAASAVVVTTGAASSSATVTVSASSVDAPVRLSVNTASVPSVTGLVPAAIDTSCAFGSELKILPMPSSSAIVALEALLRTSLKVWPLSSTSSSTITTLTPCTAAPSPGANVSVPVTWT